MKTQWTSLLRHCAALGLAMGMAISARAGDAEDFPQTVAFDIGRTQFNAGDSIIITSVHGTADTLQTNQTYCVEGTYTLTSHDEAQLAFYLTTSRDIRTKDDPKQKMRITRGTGTFRLIKTMSDEGNPHVSFYPAHGGNDFGGIYFGKGAWLWAGRGGEKSRSAETASAEGTNRVLFDYLGNPVAPPANLDPAYTPSSLRDAVLTAASNAGISVRSVEVDDSEFPFFIWATGNEDDFAKLKAQFKKMDHYEFYGSVGGNEAHVFTIIPQSAWPEDVRQRIYRRATLRMQVFFNRMITKA